MARMHTARPLGLIVRAALLSCVVVMGACVSAPAPIHVEAPLAALPPPAAQAIRYIVRSEQSELRLLVSRGGRLASLGHNHLIRAGTIDGEIALAPEFARSTFALIIPVADLQVDPPEARREEGADYQALPSAEAIAGTRRNMLGPQVLDGERFGHIKIRSVRISGPAWGPDVSIRVSLRGVERELTVPVAIAQDEQRIVATATFELRQSDFGITAFSVLGGALRVEDVIRVRLRILAEAA